MRIFTELPVVRRLHLPASYLRVSLGNEEIEEKCPSLDQPGAEWKINLINMQAIRETESTKTQTTHYCFARYFTVPSEQWKRCVYSP